MAVAMTGGDVVLKEDARRPAPFRPRRAGDHGHRDHAGGWRHPRPPQRGGIAAVDVTTDPFPGFPTDLQAQFMALMTLAKGQSHIRETIFEKPLHARAGSSPPRREDPARRRHGDRRGRREPARRARHGHDLRASVSLVIAGLAARARRRSTGFYHLDRGFEALEAKLGRCGAQIERVRG